MTDLFDSLADATRRDIVSLLRSTDSQRPEMSVGELVEALGITQPTVSKHLKVLREVGVVVVREEGQHRYYRLDEAPLANLSAWISPGGPSAPERVDPFLDLEILGRSTGGVLKDAVEFLGSLRGKLFS
jgi:DNA-binding transcriptional ArsR family regulator